MKIAIIHEMLIKIGGAEKVLESLKKLYPQADIFTLIYDEKKVGKYFPKDIIQSPCFSLPSQKIYKLLGKQRFCLPFMRKSVERLDFSSYDIVIVSSSGFAHGLITQEHTKTLIYYHAPARYMWDWAHEYRKEIGMNHGIKGFLFGKLMMQLRMWDYETAQKNTILLANSTTTQERIWKYYRRTCRVLYPPIETQRFASSIEKLDTNNPPYYIILSALTEFKRIDIAIQHFPNKQDLKLYIIGDGTYKKELMKIAGKNIHFLGAKYGDELVSLVQNSLGLIFPGEEDFGMVPIEVMAAGKPVFALHAGGLTETVIGGKTGEFFKDPKGKDFQSSFQNFHENNLKGIYTSTDCKLQAAKFDQQVFHTQLTHIVENMTS